LSLYVKGATAGIALEPFFFNFLFNFIIFICPRGAQPQTVRSSATRTRIGTFLAPRVDGFQNAKFHVFRRCFV